MFQNSPHQQLLHDPSTPQIFHRTTPSSFTSVQSTSILSSDDAVESNATNHVLLDLTPKQQNKCLICSRETKYMCVKCNVFVCNICSQPANPNCKNYNEDGEYRHVGYCPDCFTEVWWSFKFESVLVTVFLLKNNNDTKLIFCYSLTFLVKGSDKYNYLI